MSSRVNPSERPEHPDRAEGADPPERARRDWAATVFARLAAHGRLRQLQLLTEIEDCGSIARAAERLHLSQPAATQALSELERLLELQLFERHARGVRTTAAGRVLLGAARGIVATLEEAAEALAAIRTGAPAALRLGAIPAATAALLPDLLSAFSAAHPDVHLELQEDHGGRLLPQLTAGLLDAVFCRRPQALPHGFVFEALRGDAIVVLAADTHPCAQRAGLCLTDLADALWVLPSPRTQLRGIFERVVRPALPLARQLPVSTLSLSLTEGLLRRPGAVALVPASLSVELERHAGITRLDLELGAQLDPLGVAYDERRVFPLLEDCLVRARDLAPVPADVGHERAREGSNGAVAIERRG